MMQLHISHERRALRSLHSPATIRRTVNHHAPSALGMTGQHGYVNAVWFFEVFGFGFFEMAAQIDQDLVNCFIHRQQLNAGLKAHGIELPTLHLA